MNGDRLRKHHIWFLLSEKHPQCCIEEKDWTPDTVPLICPIENPDDRARYQEAARDYEEISELSDEALRKRIDAVRVDKEQARNAEREASHPFNSAAAKATRAIYDIYAKLDYWEESETVALLLGRNPKILTYERARLRQPPSEILRRHSNLRESLTRAIASGHLSTLYPGYVLGWARKRHIDIPKELEDAVVEHGHDIIDPIDLAKGHPPYRKGKIIAPAGAKSDNAKPLGTRERENLLRTIIGMAIGGYGYDPNAGRTTTVKDISDDLRAVGLTLGEDTIRKYLNEAKELLPGNWNE